ncbi:MAG: arsenate reductase (azurin) small subunit [Chloroflexi bacterium]|nr:arsenate reductase (azurin) small subunit [Chloroflexota bacterium]
MTAKACDPKAALTRRQFLFLGGGALVTLAMPRFLHGVPAAEGLSLQMAAYPRQKVGQLSTLKLGQPVEFKYPFDHPNCTNFLYKLGKPAGGGIGPALDVVAFNNLCPHQGGPLAGRLNAEHQVLGPCPLHLTTFDLTRHGMVVSGHATEGLPQIVLELEGDDIVATGVMGLLYGFHNNRVDPAAERGR